MGFESLPWLEIMKWRRKPAIGRRPLIFSDVDRIRMIEPLLPFRMKRRSVFRLSNFSSVWKWGEKVRESQRRRQREAEGGRGRERGGSVVNPNHGGSSSKIINYQKWKKKKYIYIYMKLRMEILFEVIIRWPVRNVAVVFGCFLFWWSGKLRILLRIHEWIFCFGSLDFLVNQPAVGEKKKIKKNQIEMKPSLCRCILLLLLLLLLLSGCILNRLKSIHFL